MCFWCMCRQFLRFRCAQKKGIEINQNKTKAILKTKPPSTMKVLQSLLGKINFLRRFISNLSVITEVFSPLLRLKKYVFKWEPEHKKAFGDIKAYLMNPPILLPPLRDKVMKLYIAASDNIIGSMLAQEDENGAERAIYYLSRVLNDAEKRYHPIEKLCLCLYILFWTGQRPGLNHLGPITNQAQILHLENYSQHTPSSRGGCSEHPRPVQTNSNVSLHTFPRISHRQLHFCWFRNRRSHVCFTTAMHSPTSINRRLLAASKVESLTLSNPHSKLYWLERRSVCRYTPHIQSNGHWKYKQPPWTTAFNTTPILTFWSGMISDAVCG